MERGTLEEPSSSFFCLEEEESSRSLNDACLLSDSELGFGEQEPSLAHSFPFIPETPSPLMCRRKRNSHVAENHSETGLRATETSRSEARDVPGYLYKTPSSQRTLKRRRLQNAALNQQGCKETGTGTGFVLASSLVPSNLVWMESPRPSQSTVPSSSSASCAGAPACSVLRGATGHRELIKTPSQDLPHGHRKQSRGSKRTSTTRLNHRLVRSVSTAPVNGAMEGLSENTDTEGKEEGVNSQVCEVQEEIIIIEEDEEDVVVEATVRSIQMAEDEAFARSLQDQFDREEQLHQEHRRLETVALNPTQNTPANSYVGLSWIYPWAAMVNSPAFADVYPGRRGRQPRESRNSRRRSALSVPLAMLDDSQGNNYEALLAFEESQGAVLKKTLSKGEIDRLPTKVYDPANNAGKTDCQICFSDYNKGEKLRMLPCFHDYHVKCIDRWLKENASCPICRADVSV